MSSYWSALLTTTTARVASIRQNLLSSEDDGDTEDDTHICRVLRSHYIENGRPFPAWLPPDPRAPPPANSQSANVQSNTSSKYGGLGSQSAVSTSFASLFSNTNEPENEQPFPQEAPNFRQGRGNTNMRQDPNTGESKGMFKKLQPSSGASIVQSRPLPSKMVGSYQSAIMGVRGNNHSIESSASQNSRPMSAKDRLRAGNLRRPDPRTVNSAETYSQNNMVKEKSDKPFVAATSPWASNEDEFGGAGYEPPPRAKPRGLPAGPAAGRKMGLPSGPRGPRKI
ncbi:putative mfs sugar transporter [Golovinomyces cichoracearum]|uniref:Putative mfs sugar transporter n=1 Tax=Golovinomyces cichoracearum TaxID=62708 RepID=A0A420J456_9PEZI|nr:putative mfs sugar transporter [Golovinomyces cichoracearum]